ncbi:hypothetical protein OC846_006340 [Tilletia horrida]|uniref:Uncharacterized protein n=1 Tax=Tilletia horrida TaxID=155126 RepID=A0AAN6GNU5_9BASI|nr:hypothetical protein OC846_006340 [Tilletia horrida]KAK0548794.1 hypothetical protein OC845_003413 [Tilletia horrida]KAK0562817.1 hypothetical protein OC861_005129 [Tilletia horrida]
MDDLNIRDLVSNYLTPLASCFPCLAPRDRDSDEHNQQGSTSRAQQPNRSLTHDDARIALLSDPDGHDASPANPREDSDAFSLHSNIGRKSSRKSSSRKSSTDPDLDSNDGARSEDGVSSTGSSSTTTKIRKKKKKSKADKYAEDGDEDAILRLQAEEAALAEEEEAAVKKARKKAIAKARKKGLLSPTSPSAQNPEGEYYLPPSPLYASHGPPQDGYEHQQYYQEPFEHQGPELPEGAEVTYVYDEFGRPLQVINGVVIGAAPPPMDSPAPSSPAIPQPEPVKLPQETKEESALLSPDAATPTSANPVTSYRRARRHERQNSRSNGSGSGSGFSGKRYDFGSARPAAPSSPVKQAQQQQQQPEQQQQSKSPLVAQGGVAEEDEDDIEGLEEVDGMF